MREKKEQHFVHNQKACDRDRKLDDDAKKAARNQHVVPNRKGGWSVRKSGSSNVSRTFDDKSAAVDYATRIAQVERSELYIHKKDGTIKDRKSYAYDSLPRKNK